MGVSLGFPKGPQHPFGTRLCLQSLVCYTLVPADAEKGLRAAPASTLFCGRRMRGRAWLLTVFAHPAQACRGTNGVHSPSCRSSVLPMRRRANDQRLCLPRIPAFVRCFSMEDLLNTRSRVICSSFVSLE